MSEQTQAVILAEPDKGIRSWQPMSGGDLLKYSAASFQKYFMPRTKKGHAPSQIDGEKALMFCMANRLDPRKPEVYFVGYDTENGPQWSPVVAYTAYLSRASSAKGFKGFEYGVTVSRKTDGAEIMEDINGELCPKGVELLGGWCRVHFDDQFRFPQYVRLSLQRFDRGTAFWKQNPEGMITKCAIAAAHRKAFPDTLGSLFIQEEMPERNITPIDAPQIDQTEHGEIKKIMLPPAEVVANATATDEATPQEQFGNMLIDAGFTFTDFNAWCEEEKEIGIGVATCFEELQPEFARRMMRGKKGLLAGLAQRKEQDCAKGSGLAGRKAVES